MSIKNRIMSWILHPSAYLVWHALGNPEEWETPSWHQLKHKTVDVALWMSNGPWFFDQIDEGINKLDAIGLFDRHLVYPRARKVHNFLKYGGLSGKKRLAQHKLFVKMTQLGEKP